MMDEYSVLETLTPVSLDGIGEAKLLTRIDTKFVTSSSLIASLLEMAMRDYLVLEIDSRRKMNYSTCYFDTKDAEMFYEHQRGKKMRQKVRIRSYEDGEKCSFLEVKDKNNKGKTRKARMQLLPETGEEECSAFLEEWSHYSPDRLLKQIENHFSRITLVRNDLTERVTIDTGLHFRNMQTLIDASMSETAVIEWKHSAENNHSPMKGILRSLRIRESGFSKYCIGMAKTNPLLRVNRMKDKLRTIEKLTGKFY